MYLLTYVPLLGMASAAAVAQNASYILRPTPNEQFPVKCHDMSRDCPGCSVHFRVTNGSNRMHQCNVCTLHAAPAQSNNLISERRSLSDISFAFLLSSSL